MTELEKGSVVLWLSSRYENIELVQAALAHVCRLRGIDGEMEHWIGMALREAVANAVRHGNRLDPEKRVLVSFGGEGDVLELTVGDEGDGFDPAAISDPLAPENQMKTSGRGIFYIRTFMDEVSYSRGAKGGTILTMRKDLKTRIAGKGEQ